MFKQKFFLAIIVNLLLVHLSAFADYSVTTVEPLQGAPIYSGYPYNQCNVPYYTGSQNVYQNPYTVYPNASQQQTYYNSVPYGYRSYAYGAPNVPILGTAGAGVKNQIMRNIGQSLIYSAMRGY